MGIYHRFAAAAAFVIKPREEAKEEETTAAALDRQTRKAAAAETKLFVSSLTDSPIRDLIDVLRSFVADGELC